jgi:hypothetical protein
VQAEDEKILWDKVKEDISQMSGEAIKALLRKNDQKVTGTFTEIVCTHV